MAKQIVPVDVLSLTEEAREAFGYLREQDSKGWSLTAIARIINGLTDRKMDSAAVGHFLRNNPKKPTRLSVGEAIRIRDVAVTAREEFDHQVQSLHSPVKIQFLDAAYSIDLKIPVSAELYEKFKNDESLKKFLDETVRNALAFAERSFIPSPD